MRLHWHRWKTTSPSLSVGFDLGYSLWMLALCCENKDRNIFRLWSCLKLCIHCSFRIRTNHYTKQMYWTVQFYSLLVRLSFIFAKKLTYIKKFNFPTFQLRLQKQVSIVQDDLKNLTLVKISIQCSNVQFDKYDRVEMMIISKLV